MPGRDGSGPWGRGSMTGRGMGICRGYGVYGYPRGYRFANYPYGVQEAETDKDFLEDEKKALKSRLEEIDRILDAKR